MTAFTSGGSVDSDIASITLADVPDKPTVAPYLTYQSASKLEVTYDALLASNNGGTAILSYSLEMDDGMGGTFVAVTGLSKDNLHTS